MGLLSGEVLLEGVDKIPRLDPHSTIAEIEPLGGGHRAISGTRSLPNPVIIGPLLPRELLPSIPGPR